VHKQSDWKLIRKIAERLEVGIRGSINNFTGQLDYELEELEKHQTENKFMGGTCSH
jgi:hypothetical protein